MDKRKALLRLIRLGGLLSLAALLIVKDPRGRWLEKLCAKYNLDNGDLYPDARVRLFKIPPPARQGPELVRTPSAQSGRYRVFVMGDSFMPFRFGHETFVLGLSKRLGEPIGYEGWDVPSPACIFRRLKEPVDPSQKRLVVLESVERLLPERFSEMKPCPPGMPEDRRATRSVSAFLARAFELVFEDREQRLRALLRFNPATSPAAVALAELRFYLLGTLTDAVPVYSLNPPLLFLRSETDPNLPSSFYARHDDALIEKLADNVKSVADALKSEAGADLVFLPIPSKYTILHVLMNRDPYDRFLPRLCDAVERRGVRTVRLYEKFAADPAAMYYPTDAHWTPRAIDIALDETMATVRTPRRKRPVE